MKLNLATVLKESQLYKKQEEELRRRLMDYEAGGKDGEEFFQWQETMLKQDYQDELNQIERKRLEGKLSYEEAILARERLAEENRRVGEEIRRETRQAIEDHVKEKVKEEQRMKSVRSRCFSPRKTLHFTSFFSFRQLIDEVVNGRDNAKLAQQKLQQYKSDFVKQYKEEFKQMMKQALEEVWTSFFRLRSSLIVLRLG